MNLMTMERNKLQNIVLECIQKEINNKSIIRVLDRYYLSCFKTLVLHGTIK